MRVASLDQLFWDQATPAWARQVIREIRDTDPVDALATLEAMAAAIRQDNGLMPYDGLFYE